YSISQDSRSASNCSSVKKGLSINSIAVNPHNGHWVPIISLISQVTFMKRAFLSSANLSVAVGTRSAAWSCANNLFSVASRSARRAFDSYNGVLEFA
ncbi:unnamed protein product, partial [Haemonchus placei]|uniref:Pecanex-like protein n=1 Tax=Haemonchus placei TaxID=6290 RepID=A0A0N4X9K9_HAEPC